MRQIHYLLSAFRFKTNLSLPFEESEIARASYLSEIPNCLRMKS